MFGKDAFCCFIVLIYFKAFDENDKKTYCFSDLLLLSRYVKRRPHFSMEGNANTLADTLGTAV